MKSSAITIIDNLVASYDNAKNDGYPALATVWGLAKGAYEAGIQLRRDRAIEFIEIIRDNPSIFTRKILETEEFQDGFVYTLQKYLSERTEEKRKIIKSIFLGFTKETDKDKFKLERMLYTVEQLSIEDIEVLKIFYDGTINEWIRKQFPNNSDEETEKHASQPVNILQVGDLILNEMKGLKQFKNGDYTLESLMRLTNLGLLIGGIDTKWDNSSSNFRKSLFGKEFADFILY